MFKKIVIALIVIINAFIINDLLGSFRIHPCESEEPPEDCVYCFCQVSAPNKICNTINCADVGWQELFDGRCWENDHPAWCIDPETMEWHFIPCYQYRSLCYYT